MHAVERYARDVDEGKIVAGPSVRGECSRFLRDLRDGHKRGLTFDEDAANRAIHFFPDVLTVEIDDQAAPFELLDWQTFVIGNLFGWKIFDVTRGKLVRRYTSCYIETGKGSGKSPLAAGVGLYCMVADGVESAEVYAAATIKQQAMILFKDATKMVQRSPALDSRLVKSGGNPIWQWTHPQSNSIFKPLSSDEMVSGPRPNCALIDEYHEHKTSNALDMLEAGFKGRANPLMFIITNSGANKATPCGEMHDYAVQVATGVLKPEEFDTVDRFFTFVTDLDPGDDPLNDETCWPKANPSLGHTIQPEYLRRAVATAKEMPSRQNIILRLNFCVWTDSEAPWISRELWEAAETDEDLAALHEGEECFTGLDLSFTQDLSSKANCWFRLDDKGERMMTDGKPHYDLVVYFWKPEGGLQAAIDRDRVRYDVWAEQGHLNLTQGKVIRLEPIALSMSKDQERYDLKSVAYDAYRHRDLRENMDEMNIVLPMMEHPQGFRRARLFTPEGEPVKDPETGRQKDNPLWMPGSVQELENAALEGRLRVQVNPVMRWNVGGVVLREDPSGVGNSIIDKRKSTVRVDGAVASAMAVGAAKAGLSAPKKTVSPYEDESFSLANA